MSGEVVDLEEAEKKKFVAALCDTPLEDRIVALRLNIPFATVKRWRMEDSEFDLACTEAQELALDQVEETMFNQAIEGDGRLGIEILKLRRPEKYNPSYERKDGAVGHRFMDFNGQPLHGEVETDESQTLLERSHGSD